MYVAAIRLRYSQPDIARTFKIPGGIFEMWAVGLAGLSGALIATGFSFLSPAQIHTGNPAVYIAILLAGTACFAALPFIIFAFHKPGWESADSDFEPFESTSKKHKLGSPAPVSKKSPAPVAAAG